MITSGCLPQKYDAVNKRHGCISHAQDALSNDDADPVAEQPSSVRPEMLAAIKLAIKDVIGTQLANIGKELTQLVQINERNERVEHTMQATNYRLENVITMMLPTITAHISHLAEALARRQLKLKVHRQKWNLVMHSIQGDAKEDESVTRQTCMQFAKTVLKVLDAETTAFTACHRLSHKPNAGIILQFVDLAQRDSWISGAKHLKNYSGMVPISPDTPTPHPNPHPNPNPSPPPPPPPPPTSCYSWYSPSEERNYGSAFQTPNGSQTETPSKIPPPMALREITIRRTISQKAPVFPQPH